MKGPGEFIHRHLGISVIAFEEVVVQQMEKSTNLGYLPPEIEIPSNPQCVAAGAYRLPGNMKHNMQGMRRHDQTDDNDA